MQNNEQKKIILFDGVCNLCSRLVRFIIRRDKSGQFYFAPLQSEQGKRLIDTHAIKFDTEETMILIDGESASIKSTAAFKVLKELDSTWKIFYPLRYLPLGIRDYLYTLIAKSRYSIFGKTDVCMVPTDEIKSRFLD